MAKHFEIRTNGSLNFKVFASDKKEAIVKANEICNKFAAMYGDTINKIVRIR